MSILNDYENIYAKLHAIQLQIDESNKALEDIVNHVDMTIPDRVKHLEDQVEKIDEYLLKIKGFRQLAEQHIQSKNLLTIEAPPNYRVNLNRLRRWAMMIDPLSNDDVYAQKVYLVAACDEFFLEKKRAEFLKKAEDLSKAYESGNVKEVTDLNKRLEVLHRYEKELANGEEMQKFTADTLLANRKYIFNESKDRFEPVPSEPDVFAPGAYGLPLSFEEEEREYLKNILGMFYDKNAGRVYLPVELLKAKNEFIMTISCVPSRNRVSGMDAGLRNLLLNIIDQSPVGSRKIYLFDAERQNASLLGGLKKLAGSYVVNSVPKNEEQMSAELEKLVSSFSDLDEYLEDYDTVVEFNADHPDAAITRSIVVVVGWPKNFSGNDRNLLQRMITNYERYGISLVLVNIGESDKKNPQRSFGLSEYISEDVIHIDVRAKETILSYGENDYKFAWYPFKGELTDSYVESLFKYEAKQVKIGNEYTKHFDFSRLPAYTREYKNVELPFGINGKEEVQTLSFENENFAAYVVGASRSGKSTLLHTLIAGIIRNYHPDNVELWLADFKQLEFEKYIRYLPPHVKYVLLDESKELVFDLIDKLTGIMMERQHLLARLGKERINQLNPMDLEEPLPVIFVILDEFSIMSQAIKDTEDYKLRLQNLLAKGAALGIKFLFSSQSFTTGISGLTATSKAQIQQRIAMKASKEEISATLELSYSMKTEQVQNWIDALPPHYALVKCRTGVDALPEVKRNLVMYFEDYGPRNDMIKMINQRMKAVDVYDPSDINTYVKKNPVLVDGKAFAQFDEAAFQAEVKERKQKDEFAAEETYLSLGNPRLMTKTRLISLTPESRENMLLISKLSEQACAAAILSSVMKSYALQGKKVSLWAYSKNKMYRSYKKLWKSEEYKHVTIYEDNDEVCMAIASLKEKLLKKETSDEIIIMLGMDRICGDFEFCEAKASGKLSAVHSVKSEGVADTDEKKAEMKLKQKAFAVSEEARAQAELAGKTPEECDEIAMRAMEDFLEKAKTATPKKSANPFGAPKAATASPFGKTTSSNPFGPKKEEKTPAPAAKSEKKEESPAYNATADFTYILKHGSRSGYHFLMALNNYSDMKQALGKLEYFRHRLGFQQSKEDARDLFGYRHSSELPEHICQYYDTLESFSFRPYLHKGIGWDGWSVDENGETVSPYVTKD